MENYRKISSLFFFLHHLSVMVAGTGDSSLQPPYYPAEENILIACGWRGTNSAVNGRTWVGDVNSQYFPFEPQQNPSKTFNENQRLPYSNSRFSHSQFAYTFNLTAGQKFIRLHFYPTPKQGFDNTSAYFSVTAGSFTLVKNFSALLAALDLQQTYFFKEFCINIEEDHKLLNITFTPSKDYNDSYAFINGIELISMPLNLYYTAADDSGFPFLGQGNPYSILNRNALETLYRINVGGRQISPWEDCGSMYRTWVPDDSYVTDARPSVIPPNNNNSSVISRIHNYSAPAEVYNTARTMGLDRKSNENYNLTWEFQVDSGFTYFLRLHFCEFQEKITKEGNRVFSIFIANLTAEPAADVIAWSGGNGISVYRDYAVMIGSKPNEKKQNLFIKLHPAPEWRTNYSDAILNGLEIFKVDNTGNLAGPNPEPQTMMIGPSPTTKPKAKNNRATLIGVSGGAVSGFVLLSLLLLLIFRRARKFKDSSSNTATSFWGPFFSSTAKSSKSRGSFLPSDFCTHFSLSEIKAATNNFDSDLIIGVGGFGNVYKGFINGSTTPVAIKRLNPESKQGAMEFQTEIGMLSQLRHLHLVSLIGYCKDDREMILVYDFMAHGTLRDHLYNSDNPPLPWNQRLEICIGAARGLHYLHTGAKNVIIHRDVKTTNILLDEKWEAKVSDFGLSKFGPNSVSKTHVSTVVKGSFGYLDPEYYRLQQLTEKSDVYSFGVVLFEVLCARPPILRSTVEKKQVSLAVWGQQCYRNGTIYENVDPLLRGKIKPECLNKYVEVAMSCLDDDGTRRPSMSDVVWGLEFALQLQESCAKENEHGHDHHIDPDDVEAEEKLLKHYETDDSGVVFSRVGEHVLDSKSISMVTISSTTTIS